MWKNTTDTSKIGNYVYGLAIPVFGSTYIVKYVGQASSSNITRCFQHAEEAKKYLAGRGSSNVKKVEMINYFNSNEDLKIVILAHNIPPDGQLNTMENIYRQLADYGALLFTIKEDELVFENNLTNIAATHNDKPSNLLNDNIYVKPRTVKQIDAMYANKRFLNSQQIASKLNAKEVLFALNRPGIQSDGYIGAWPFNHYYLNNYVEWLVFVGDNGFINYVFK